MKNCVQRPSIRLGRFAPRSVLALAWLLAAALLGGTARADALAYSFESATNDGFSPNGGGVTVSQDTIGATVGTHSLKISIVGGATFVGAQTSVLDTTTIGNSAIIGNPPGLDHVTFDLTIPAQFPPEDPMNPGHPLPGFANISMTVFGRSQDGTTLADAQFQANEMHLDGLAAGLHKDFRIDLTMSNPALPVNDGGAFNDVFGTGLRPDGEEKLVPTGLQFYINKSQLPLTVYIDNVRFGTTVPGDYNGNGIVDAADYTTWRDHLGQTFALPNRDTTNSGAINQQDYTFWKSRFGLTSGSGALSSAAVPEPGTGVLLLIAAVCWSVLGGWKRRPRTAGADRCRQIFACNKRIPE